MATSKKSSKGGSSRGGKPRLDAQTRIAVLHGPDAFVRRSYLEQLEQALEQAHGGVETYQFDGESATLAEVLDEVRTFSMLSPYKLVLVESADEFVKRYRSELERYAQSPVDHATLVLRSVKWHKGNLDKKIAKVGAVLKCEAPDQAELVRWLTERSESKYGRAIEREAARRLVEHMGRDMLRLDVELEKLSVCGDANSPIDASLVDETVGWTSEDKAWVVQEAALEAVVSGRPLAPVVHELVERAGQPEVLVMYFLSDLMRKLCVAHTMLRAGVPMNQICRSLKVFRPRDQLFARCLREVPADQARRWFSRALELDARSKSGFGDAMRNLECFGATLADR